MQVRFNENGWDRLVKDLGDSGIGAKAIAQATNLSEFQVRYRLTAGGVKLSEYRSGMSPRVRQIMQDARRTLREAGMTTKAPEKSRQ